MAFNPDEYLAQNDTGKFNPDTYLGKQGVEPISQQGESDSAVLNVIKSLLMNDLTNKAAKGLALGAETLQGPQTGLFGTAGILSGATPTEPMAWGGKKYSAGDLMRRFGIEDTTINQGFDPAFKPSGIPGDEGLPDAIKIKLSQGSQGVVDPMLVSGIAGKVIPKVIEGSGTLARILGAVGEAKFGLPMVGKIGEGAEVLAHASTKAFNKAFNQIGEYFKPIPVKNEEELINIAKSVPGLDINTLPSGARFGKNKSIANLERAVIEGGSGNDLVDNYANSKKALDDHLKENVAQVSGGSVPDRMQSGAKIVEVHDKALKELMDGMEQTNSSVLKEHPGMSLTQENTDKIDEFLREKARIAEKTLSKGAEGGKKEAKSLLNNINSIQNSKNASGLYDAEDLLFSIRSLGDDVFSLAGKYDLPLNIKEGKQIYHELNNIRISDIGEQLGKDVADNLKNNNKIMSEFFKKTNYIKKAAMSGKSEELIYKNLIESGDLRTLKNLKETMPEAMNQARGTYLDNLIQRDGLGEIHYKSTINKLDDRAVKEKLAIMFSDDPEKLKRLNDLLKLGDSFGPLINPGSAPTFSIRSAMKDVGGESAIRAKLDLAKARAGSVPGGEKTMGQSVSEALGNIPGAKGFAKFMTNPTPMAKVLRQPVASGVQKLSESAQKKIEEFKRRNQK